MFLIFTGLSDDEITDRLDDDIGYGDVDIILLTFEIKIVNRPVDILGKAKRYQIGKISGNNPIVVNLTIRYRFKTLHDLTFSSPLYHNQRISEIICIQRYIGNL